MFRTRFIGSCPHCRRRRKIVTDVDFRAPYVRSAYCHGCKTALPGFRLLPPRIRADWSPPDAALDEAFRC